MATLELLISIVEYARKANSPIVSMSSILFVVLVHFSPKIIIKVKS